MVRLGMESGRRFGMRDAESFLGVVMEGVVWIEKWVVRGWEERRRGDCWYFRKRRLREGIRSEGVLVGGRVEYVIYDGIG